MMGTTLAHYLRRRVTGCTERAEEAAASQISKIKGRRPPKAEDRGLPLMSDR